MTTNLYIIPIDHLTPSNYNVPRYLPHRFQAAFAGLEGVQWMWSTYLLGDVGIIVCDVNAAQDAILSARPGVFPIPNIDATVPNTNVRNQIRTGLEDAFVPGNWVNTGMAYRAIMRTVGGEFDYHGRVVGTLSAKLFDGTKTLATTISQCSTAQQEAFISAASDLGLTYSATGATTLRALIRGMGEQHSATPYVISGNIGSYSI